MKASFIRPMLATLKKTIFSDKDWLFERKLDGIRCIAVINTNKVTLYSRNKLLMNISFPEIVKALEKLHIQDTVIDGEIVALEESKDKFSLLQSRMHLKKLTQEAQKIKVRFFVFDLLIDKGKDLRKRPLLERKERLKKIIKESSFIKFLSHKKKEGTQYFKLAKKKGWEGVLAKMSTSHYLSKRTTLWQKFKCSNGQEFIIIGYTPPQGSRVGFGAILIGYYEKGVLKFAGKVGTGFKDDILIELTQEMRALKIDKCPLKSLPHNLKAIWIKPKLVCEVAFTEWTTDGKLRHPSFLGIRKDKAAKQVIRERSA